MATKHFPPTISREMTCYAASIGEQLWWTGGEKNRPLSLHRPCACGCDEREGFKGVGYLTGSGVNGEGFTVWICDERIYQTFAKLLAAQGGAS